MVNLCPGCRMHINFCECDQRKRDSLKEAPKLDSDTKKFLEQMAYKKDSETTKELFKERAVITCPINSCKSSFKGFYAHRNMSIHLSKEHGVKKPVECVHCGAGKGNLLNKGYKVFKNGSKHKRYSCNKCKKSVYVDFEGLVIKPDEKKTEEVKVMNVFPDGLVDDKTVEPIKEVFPADGISLKESNDWTKIFLDIQRILPSAIIELKISPDKSYVLTIKNK